MQASLPIERLSRYFVILFSLLNIVLLGGEKIAFRNYLNFLRKRGRNLRSLLIVGAGEVGRSFYELIKPSALKRKFKIKCKEKPMKYLDTKNKNLNGNTIVHISAIKW